MNEKRKVYAPFSLTSEAGVAQTPVEGYIDVNQTIYPTVDTGSVNENGKWVGVKASDDEFLGFTKDETIANGGHVLVPTGANAADNFIDMTGFEDLFIAIKTTNGGNFQISAIMGPSNSETTYANLSPLNSGAALKYKSNPDTASDGRYNFVDVFSDTQEALTADVWNIFMIQSRARNWKNLQFKLTNDSGAEADIEFAYMRML